MTFKVRDAENKKYLFECQDAKSESGHSLLVTVASSHAGRINGNFKFYRPDRMQDSVHTWKGVGGTQRPVLMHHDSGSDSLGRVAKARYVDLSYKFVGSKPEVKNTLFYDSKKKMDLYKSVNWIVDNLHGVDDYSGLGFIELGLNITNPDAIGKIQRGEYATVSVGFTTNQAICSACHTDWSQDDKCEHRPGDMVDGRRMFLIAGDFDYEEVSFVNFPADPYAKVLNKQDAVSVSDSVANRAFFMGLNIEDQVKLRVMMSDALVIHGFAEDIRPASNGEDSMDLEKIQASVKDSTLTKETAVELLSTLEAFKSEDAKEVKTAKRSLTTLKALIRKNGWADSEGVTVDSVNAKIANLAEHLKTFTDEKEKADYIAALEAEASAFGIDFTYTEDAVQILTPTADATTSTVVEPEIVQNDVSEIKTIVDAELTAKVPAENAEALVALEGLHTAYKKFSDENKYLVRYAVLALTEFWSAGSSLDYYKNRLAGKDSEEIVVSVHQYDGLVEGYEEAEKQLKLQSASNLALLDANKVMARDQRSTLVNVLVMFDCISDGSLSTITPEQLQEKIDSKSKRQLISLKDSLEDVKARLPSFKSISLAPSVPAVVALKDSIQVVADKPTEAEMKQNGISTDPVQSIANIVPRSAINNSKDRMAFQRSHAADNYKNLKNPTGSKE